MLSEMPSSAAASEAPVVTATTVTIRRRVRLLSVSFRSRINIGASPPGENVLRAIQSSSRNHQFVSNQAGLQGDRVAATRHANRHQVDRSIAVVADQHFALLMVAHRGADSARVERYGVINLRAPDDH